MQKHQQVEPTYLISLEQAGLDILYAFMLADSHVDDREFNIIQKYLADEKVHRSALFNHEHSMHSEVNLTKEFAYLKSLDAETIKRRFKKAVASFRDWVKDDAEGPAFMQKTLDFAVSLVSADGKITPEEQELIDFIKKEWKL